MSTSPIADVLARHTAQWLALDGVLGTSVGLHDGQPCVKVLVARITPALAEKIPAVLEGYRVVLEQTAPFRLEHPGQGGEAPTRPTPPSP